MTDARERVLTGLMLGLASGAMLVPLNTTMLAVALPEIMVEFELSASRVTSLVSLYLATVAITLPAAGALADRFGGRTVFLVGVLGFGSASLLAATTTSFEVLELARILQAVSGALVSTASTVLVREAAPDGRRGEAFGLFDLLVSVSAAVGPFLGGVIVGLAGWRTTFLLAAPFALVAVALVSVLAGRSPARERHPRAGRGSPWGIDIPGLALLGLAIGGLVAGLRAETPSPLREILLVAAVPAAILFIVVELGRDRPAVDPRLFLRPAFAAAVASVFGMTIVLHGTFIVVPLQVGALLREPPTTSGIVLLGVAAVSAVVAPLAGRASDRRGRRVIAVAGTLVMAAALGGLWQLGGGASVAWLALLLGVVGLGMGLAGAPRQAAAMEAIESHRAGMAAGTYYAGRYLGGAVGATLVGGILGASVTDAGVTLAFGILTIVAVVAAVISIGLPGRVERARIGSTRLA